MANNFFDDKQEENLESDKIKLGDSEFSAEELQDLVGAGKKLKELEEKQGQPVDDILKSWGRRGEEIGKLKKELEEARQPKAEEQPIKPSQITDDLRAQIRAELTEVLGGEPLTKKEFESLFNEKYQTNRGGERLYSQANKVLKQAKKDGKPVTTVENLLEYMADPSNPKDPSKAYKSMFESELDKWKEQQLMKIKRTGFMTEEKSTAGSKMPVEKVPQTSDELKHAINEFLNASE